MRLYTVYKHTTPEGKVYIGMTKKTPAKRFDFGRGYHHNARFNEAIDTFGWDNIEHSILAEGLTREEAEALEVQLITQYKSTDPAFGYNIRAGGLRGGGMSENARQTLSERMRGDNNPTRRCGHPFLGRKHTAESKQKMSLAASSRTGRTVSEVTRARLRQAQAKRAVIDLETGTVYEGIHEAAEATGLDATRICAVCKGKRKTTGGKRWEYVKG